VIEVCQQGSAYLVNHIREFHQLYDIGTFRNKDEMVWFEISMSQFEVTTRLNMLKIYSGTILSPQNIKWW